MRNVTDFFVLMQIQIKLVDDVENVRKIIEKTFAHCNEDQEKLKEEYEEDLKRFIENEKELIPEDQIEAVFWDESNRDSYYEEKNLINKIYYQEQLKLMIVLIYKTFENARSGIIKLIKTSQLFSIHKKEINSLFHDAQEIELKELKLIYNCIKHNDDKVDDNLSKNFSNYKLNNDLVIKKEQITFFYQILQNKMTKIYIGIKKLYR